MREKYIDERWPLLRVFGKHATTGQPCVTDANDSIDLFMQDDKQAKLLVDHYAKLHAEFTAMTHAFDKVNPEAFEQFWYNREE